MTHAEMLKVAFEIGYQTLLDDEAGMQKRAGGGMNPAEIEALLSALGGTATKTVAKSVPRAASKAGRTAAGTAAREGLSPFAAAQARLTPAQVAGMPVPTRAAPAANLAPAAPRTITPAYTAPYTQGAQATPAALAGTPPAIPARPPVPTPPALKPTLPTEGPWQAPAAQAAASAPAALVPAKPTPGQAAKQRSKAFSERMDKQRADRAEQAKKKLEPAAPAPASKPEGVITTSGENTPGLRKFDAKGNRVPDAPAKKLEPAKPAAGEAAAPGAEGAPAPALSDAQVAEQMQAARGIPDQTEYAKKIQELEKGYGKQMGAIRSEGAVNPLLSWGAPLAIGAGGGYLADGQQGAATGAGAALGMRAGAGPMLKRIAESRGIAKTLGGKMPALGEAFSSLPKDEVAKALALGGGLGVGGGVAGHYLGKEKKKEPWYNQLMGLTPMAAQLALPYMAMRGSNPQLMAQMQGLVPASPSTTSPDGGAGAMQQDVLRREWMGG